MKRSTSARSAGSIVKQNRVFAFKSIAAALAKEPEFLSTSDAILCLGDAVRLLKKIPTQTISLIVTDPPYHVTKKRNITNDTSFENDESYVDWFALLVAEWRRILKPNGSLYCFCDSSIAYRLEAVTAKNFNLLNHVVWTKPNEPGFDGWKQKMKKEALRQWYAHSERVIFGEPGFEGNLGRSYLGLLLREVRKRSGLTSNQLTEITGAYGKVNHGGAVSNWETGRNIPSREQYGKMCAAFFGTGKILEMPAYEDVVRPFFTNSKAEFVDIWTFPSVRPYKGKHPAEKPLSMLSHIISSSSFDDDIVLDCFSGSGNTARAALDLGRKAIAFDIDPIWVQRSKTRIFGASDSSAKYLPQNRAEKPKTDLLELPFE